MRYTRDQLDMIAYAAQAQSLVYEDIQHDSYGVQWSIYSFDGKSVLAVKGTNPKEMEDIQANASFTQISLGPGGKVHAGYYQQALVIQNHLKKYRTKIDYVCGHSLGGSVAQIIAYLEDKPVVTFGSLRCMDPYAADLFHSTNTCFRFTLRGDKIPHAVFAIKPVKWWGWIPVWFARYKHVGHHVKIGQRKIWNHAHKDYRAEVEDWLAGKREG